MEDQARNSAMDSNFDEAYQDINGLRLCKAFEKGKVQSALSYRPVHDDVFIVSYPKCGTTWMQNILHGMFTRGQEGIPNMSERRAKMPFLELMGAEAVKEMIRPGAIKTHLPFDMIPYSENAKYIYITRNPYDCCVSFYHHTKKLPFYSFQNGTFDQFFDMFIEGKVEYGDYFSHLLRWYEHRNDLNVLFLTYEDLKRDIRAIIRKTANLLGEQTYGVPFREDAQLLEKVVELSSIDKSKSVNAEWNKWIEEFVAPSSSPSGAMKSKLLSQDGAPLGQARGQHVRKGIVGDWKNHFTQGQVSRMKNYIALKTAGSDIMSLWKDTEIL
ncbi:sulfotransferase ssu-1-like [Haemaphysalis longicornis]